MNWREKLQPTTPGRLVQRVGMVSIDYCFRGISVRQWTPDGGRRSDFAAAATASIVLAEKVGTTGLLTRATVGGVDHTIRLLLDGDDALVAVYTAECIYHKSMARAMRRVLRVLKEKRKTDEADTFVGSCSEMGGYDQDDEDDRPRGCA